MKQNRKLSQAFACSILRAAGWKMVLNFPPTPKFVLIGAPHTSNWDFAYFLLLKFGADINLNWIGKDSLFRWPVGIVMKWLGGIPVDRRSSNNFVTQIVTFFDKKEGLIVTIAPEGTRSKAAYWKTGFYYIALGAGVPISLGFIDYRPKRLVPALTFIPPGTSRQIFTRSKNFTAAK